VCAGWTGREGHEIARGQLALALRVAQRRRSRRTSPTATPWLLVVAGAPQVRTPAGERVLRPGDILCLSVGPGGAHTLTGPGTVLIVAEERGPDVVELPDSGEVGLRTAGAAVRRVEAIDA